MIKNKKLIIAAGAAVTGVGALATYMIIKKAEKDGTLTDKKKKVLGALATGAAVAGMGLGVTSIISEDDEDNIVEEVNENDFEFLEGKELNIDEDDNEIEEVETYNDGDVDLREV